MKQISNPEKASQNNDFFIDPYAGIPSSQRNLVPTNTVDSEAKNNQKQGKTINERFAVTSEILKLTQQDTMSDKNELNPNMHNSKPLTHENTMSNKIIMICENEEDKKQTNIQPSDIITKKALPPIKNNGRKVSVSNKDRKKWEQNNVINLQNQNIDSEPVFGILKGNKNMENEMLDKNKQ